MEPQTIRSRMRSLLREKNMCVLATVGGQKPHCSLMAYLADETENTVYMFTAADSHKFKNLQANDWVSLLVDTRGDASRDRTQALTITGICETVRDKDRIQAIRRRFLVAHPHLQAFLSQPGIELLCVRVDSFLLLDGPAQAHFEQL